MELERQRVMMEEFANTLTTAMQPISQQLTAVIAALRSKSQSSELSTVKLSANARACSVQLRELSTPSKRAGAALAVNLISQQYPLEDDGTETFFQRCDRQEKIEQRYLMQSTHLLFGMHLDEETFLLRLSFLPLGFPRNLDALLPEDQITDLFLKLRNGMSFMNGSLSHSNAPPTNLDGRIEHQRKLHSCMINDFGKSFPWTEISLASRYSAIIAAAALTELMDEDTYKEGRTMLLLLHLGRVDVAVHRDELAITKRTFAFWCSAYLCPCLDTIGPTSFAPIFANTLQLLSSNDSVFHIDRAHYVHYATYKASAFESSSDNEVSAECTSICSSVPSPRASEKSNDCDIDDWNCDHPQHNDNFDYSSTSSECSDLNTSKSEDERSRSQKNVKRPSLGEEKSKTPPRDGTSHGIKCAREIPLDSHCNFCGNKAKTRCARHDKGCRGVVHKSCGDSSGAFKGCCAICKHVVIDLENPKRKHKLPRCNDCNTSVYGLDTCMDCNEPLHQKCAVDERCLKCNIVYMEELRKEHSALKSEQPDTDSESDSECCSSEDLDELIGEVEVPALVLTGEMGMIHTDVNNKKFTFVKPDNPNLAPSWLHQDKTSIPLAQGTRVSFTPVPDRRSNRAGSTHAAEAELLDFSFQSGSGRIPHTAEIEIGANFMNLVTHLPPQELLGAVEPATTEARMRIARLSQEMIRLSPDLHNQLIVKALVMALERLRVRHAWTWSTTSTMAGTLSSFMARLDVYTNARPFAVGQMGTWREFMRRITKQTHLEKPYQGPPASVDDIEIAVERLKKKREFGAAFLLIIAWAHAARVANVVTLQRANFKDQGGTILWDRAKTTATRGPYSTYSVYGRFTNFVNKHLALHPLPNSSLCTTADAAVMKKALKEVLPNCDLRSLRRGALQTLSNSGRDAEDLLLFSGHTNTKSLLRYLGFGAKFQAAKMRGTAAAAALWNNASTRTSSTMSLRA